MSPETFYNKIRTYGRKRGLDIEEANDFASTAVISFLQGRKATFKQYFIDYLRARFGNKRSRHFEKQRQIKNPELPLYEEIVGDTEAAIELRFDIQNAMRKLDGSEVYLLRLKYYYGHTTSEIATIVGVCRKTVWDRLRTALDKLRNELD